MRKWRLWYRQYILKLNNKYDNTHVVIAGAKGILQSQDRAQLAKFGGPATLSIVWAESLLTRSQRHIYKITTVEHELTGARQTGRPRN